MTAAPDSGDPSGRRLLLLSQYFWPEEMATAQMLSDVAFRLAEAGWAIDAIAGQPAYHARDQRLPRRMQEGGVAVRRVWSTRFDKNRTVGRVLNTASFTISCTLAALTTPRPDVVLAVTNPPLLHWVGAAVGGLRRRPVVLLVHDVYPDIAIALGRVPEGGWVARTWRALNRWAVRRAARVVALGDDMRDALGRSLGAVVDDRVIVIPNHADGERVRPRARNRHPLLVELGIDDRFVCLYSGNIGRFHEIETLLEAARLLRGEGIVFLFVGDGAQRPAVETAAREDPDMVRLLPFQPSDRLGELLAACDAGFVTLRDGLAGMAVPSKLYGLLAAGRAIIAVAPADCDAARETVDHGCGWVSAPGDAEGLVRLLRDLLDDPDRVAEAGRRARERFEQRYAIDIVASAWQALLDEVAESRKTRA